MSRSPWLNTPVYKPRGVEHYGPSLDRTERNHALEKAVHIEMEKFPCWLRLSVDGGPTKFWKGVRKFLAELWRVRLLRCLVIGIPGGFTLAFVIAEPLEALALTLILLCFGGLLLTIFAVGGIIIHLVAACVRGIRDSPW